MLNDKGGVLDDGIIYRFGPESFMAVVNAACAENDLATLRARLPESVKITDISNETGKVDLQGPESLDVLEKLMGQNFHDLGYFSFRESQWQGVPVLVSRTGYLANWATSSICPPVRQKTSGRPCWPTNA